MHTPNHSTREFTELSEARGTLRSNLKQQVDPPVTWRTPTTAAASSSPSGGLAAATSPPLPPSQQDLQPILEAILRMQKKNDGRLEKSFVKTQQAIGDMSCLVQALNRSANALMTYERAPPPGGFYDDFSDNFDKKRAEEDSAAPEVQRVSLVQATRRGSLRRPIVDADKMNRVAQVKVVSYPDQMCVEIKVVFLRVLSIDTIAQHFETEIYIQARWAEKQFSGLSEKDLEKIEFCQCWDPKLKIVNKIGNFSSDTLSMLLRYEEDRVYPVLTLMWQITGNFREHLELQHFPLDVQELSIVISSERPMKEIDLLPDCSYHSSVHPLALQESQEWMCYQHVAFTRDFTTTQMIFTTKHPILVVSAHVKRKLGFYFWNVLVIVFLIIGLSFTLLALSPTGTERLGVGMTLFLTAVAFKLVVKANLPTISYLTYLDIYIVFVLIYLAAQIGESAMMTHLGRFREKDKVLQYDEIAQSILVSLLLLFHIIFFLYIHYTAMKRRREMAREDYNFQMDPKKECAMLACHVAPAPQEVEMTFDNPLFGLYISPERVGPPSNAPALQEINFVRDGAPPPA